VLRSGLLDMAIFTCVKARFTGHGCMYLCYGPVYWTWLYLLVLRSGLLDIAVFTCVKVRFTGHGRGLEDD
jgi:hypothetical protein